MAASATETVRVQLAERSYDIRIGSGVLGELGTFIATQDKAWHAVVVHRSICLSSLPANKANPWTWRQICGSGCSMWKRIAAVWS
jgi:hypothetical protein